MLMIMVRVMMLTSPAVSLTTISLDTGNIAYRQAASQSHTLLHYDPGRGPMSVLSRVTCHVSRPGGGR